MGARGNEMSREEGTAWMCRRARARRRNGLVSMSERGCADGRVLCGRKVMDGNGKETRISKKKYVHQKKIQHASKKHI
jgi:uncharacterized protein (DUF169 family)